MASLWVLNLDAEQELANPAGYVADSGLTAKAREALTKARALAQANLLGPLDRVFEASCKAAGFEGRAWCPTPSALKQLASAGASLPEHPSLDVLRHVNDRAFSVALGLGLGGSAYFNELTQLQAHLKHADNWILKRAFGFAGRGQRAVATQLTADDRNWVAASLEQAGIEAVPRVELCGEFSVHGVLHSSGRLELGPIREQRSAYGAWIESRPADEIELTASERMSFFAAVEQVESALKRAGYFGPFGVDAFRWRATSGSLHFNPCSEINARYCMGWSLDPT